MATISLALPNAFALSAAFLLSVAGCNGGGPPYDAALCNEEHQVYDRIERIDVLRENGGRIDWSPVENLIAVDLLNEDDGYYDLWFLSPDGASEECMTCDRTDIPQKHIGQPAWHPSGAFLVLQIEMPEHVQGSNNASPGLGVKNNLWIMNRDGENFWQITDVPDDNLGGTLHAHFSHDGTMLSWTRLGHREDEADETTAVESVVKVADFEMTAAGPILSNVRVIKPYDDGIYENHGFDANDESILFTTNGQTGDFILWGTEIISFDLATETPVTLATGGYNEVAHYQPNGQIVWMSNACNDRWGSNNYGTDYWVMDADGSNRVRITGFNDPTSTHFKGGEAFTAADHSTSPDGTMMAAFVFTDLLAQVGQLHMIYFAEGQGFEPVEDRP